MKKQLKRMIFIFLEVFIFFGGIQICQAETTSAEDSGSCGEQVYWKIEGETLTIYGNGAMNDVVSEPASGDEIDFSDDGLYVGSGKIPWAKYSETIQRVVVEPGVTKIGVFAFAGCYQVTEIQIPDSVQEIGYAAFAGTEINSIYIPAKVTRLAKAVFFECYRLQSVIFAQGSQLQSVGYASFGHCPGLETLTLPEGVQTIEENAFFATNCVVTLPSTVTEIGENAFRETAGVMVSAENTKYASKKGVLFSKNNKKLITYPTGKTESSYTVPKTVETIGVEAFSGNKHLKKVVLTKNVRKVGAGAFYDCEGIRTILIKSKKLTKVGKEAFNIIYYENPKNTLVIKVPSARKNTYMKFFRKIEGKYKVKKL